MRKTDRITMRITALIVVAGLLAGAGAAVADDSPLPTALARRGELIVDDDGAKDRGGRVTVELNDGVGVRAALGSWNRTAPDSKVWRSTWTKGMKHPPVASYRGLETTNLIVEVTFRYGERTELSQDQFLRIAADQRPRFKGHIVSAWANARSRYTETGVVLEHVGKQDGKSDTRGWLMDHQPIRTAPSIWYTALLEIVDDEALFRMGDHVAYAKAEPIRMPKNLVSLTLGTTWHEIKRVRIWHAEANPEWETNQTAILKPRKSFTARPR